MSDDYGGYRMTDGTEVVMMPGMVLAWILIGFTVLLLVAVLRSKPENSRAFEEQGRDQIARATLV